MVPGTSSMVVVLAFEIIFG